MAISLLPKSIPNASGTVTLNGLLGGYFKISLVGNITLATPTLMLDGQLFCVRLIDTDNNIYTVGYSSAWDVDGATPYQSLGVEDGSQTCMFMYDNGHCTRLAISPPTTTAY